jgi:hypothetical protein
LADVNANIRTNSRPVLPPSETFFAKLDENGRDLRIVDSGMKNIIHQLRRALLPGVSDAQLLAHYVDQRDELAFEALVRRHGPMVLGVCKRILSDLHDAEDAFQSTFLVLVQKAGAIAPRRGYDGSWTRN